MAGTHRPLLPGPLRPAIVRMGRGLHEGTGRRSVRGRLGRELETLGLSAARRYAPMMSYFTTEQKLALYTDAVRERLSTVDSYRLLDVAFADSNADSATGRAIDADIRTYLPGDLMVKADLSTMANSLEARSPFLDHHLLEWAAGLPTRFKISGGETKYLLRRATAPWLPEQLRDRPKKGFSVPLASWLRGDLRGLAHDVLTDDTARGRDLFRPDAVATLLREHDEGVDHGKRIWALIQFELWHRMFVDAAVAPSQPTVAGSHP
jgi:asparagine synthase (glutamine-hydrolysing)